MTIDKLIKILVFYVKLFSSEWHFDNSSFSIVSEMYFFTKKKSSTENFIHIN